MLVEQHRALTAAHEKLQVHVVMHTKTDRAFSLCLRREATCRAA